MLPSHQPNYDVRWTRREWCWGSTAISMRGDDDGDHTFGAVSPTLYLLLYYSHPTVQYLHYSTVQYSVFVRGFLLKT